MIRRDPKSTPTPSQILAVAPSTSKILSEPIGILSAPRPACAPCMWRRVPVCDRVCALRFES